MALDGLGLVFEQTGNTGAAAYNQPALQIGNNPLDRVAAGMEQQNNLLQQNKLIQDRQNEKLNQQALEVGGSGWEIDNDRQLGQYLGAMKNEFTNLLAKGVKPTDYNNPESRKFFELKQGWENLKNQSLAQKKQFDDVYKTILGDMNSPNPQFEHEQSFAKMKEWQELPIEERLKTPIETLLVKKEAPFDMYAPLADIDISKHVVDDDYEDSNIAIDRDKLNKVNLKADVYATAKNPKYNTNFEKGVEDGLWKTRDEYAEVQYQKKLLEYTQKKGITRKPPKDDGDFTINNISGSGADALMGKVGYGKQSINVATDDGKFVPIDYKYTTQLGNVDVVAGTQSMIDAKTGKPIGGTGTMALKSGTIVLAPVYKGTSRPYPLTKGMNEAELIANGTIEFKPLVSGKAEQEGDDGKEQIDVWVPAEAILQSTGDSNKALSKGQASYYIYQKKADELNKKTTQSSLKGGANKPATNKSKNPNYKGDKIMQGGFEYIWNPKTNTYE